ncbi:hypothetical protein Tco_0567507 [Tanacetum coccineum]
MPESSSHDPSSPKITPKEEPVTLNKPESPNPFLLADQFEFSFDEISLTTNNEVALLYPSHLNSEYFEIIWYTAKTLDDSMIWVSTPTGEIRGDIGYSGEIGAKGTLKKSFLPARWRLLMGQIIQFLSVKIGGLDQISNKDATILYCLANGVIVDHAKLIWEDIIHKLNKKIREKVVPYPRFISFLLEYMMPEYDNEELTINPTQSSSAKDKGPSHPSPPMPVVGEMHKEAQQAAGGLTYLGDTSKEGAYPQLNSELDASIDSTAKADLRNSAPNDSIPTQQDQTKSAGDGLKTAHTNSDEPIIVSDEREEEEVEKDDTHATSYDSQKEKLEQQKGKAEEEVTSLKARPSYLDINQLTELLVTSLKPELSKLLTSHDFARCLPTELKELPSKFTTLPGDIKELKQHGIWSGSVLGLLYKCIPSTNQATTKDVLSGGQPTASSAEGEKNTNPATTNAEPNLHDELVDLLVIDVVTRMEILDQPKKELKIDFNKPLKEQDPMNELNDLANKKRKRTGDSTDHSSLCSGTETEQGLWKELQFSFVDNSKLNVDDSSVSHHPGGRNVYIRDLVDFDVTISTT